MRHINEALDDLETDIRSGKKKVTDKNEGSCAGPGKSEGGGNCSFMPEEWKNRCFEFDRPFFSQAVRDFFMH